MKRNDAARAPGGTVGGPSGLDVRSTPGARFPASCTHQGLARCFVQQCDRRHMNLLWLSALLRSKLGKSAQHSCACSPCHLHPPENRLLLCLMMRTGFNPLIFGQQKTGTHRVPVSFRWEGKYLLQVFQLAVLFVAGKAADLVVVVYEHYVRSMCRVGELFGGHLAVVHDDDLVAHRYQVRCCAI